MALTTGVVWLRWLALAFAGGLIAVGAMPVSAADRLTDPVISRLSPEEARERITTLRAEIAWHDELYFKKAAPVISDFAYDQLKRELKALEAAWPDVAGAGAKVAGVGDDRTEGFPAYRHRARMLSLNKSYTEAELKEFDARLRRQLGRDDLEYVVEPKFDGLAISVTYERGRLIRAVTRGNGEQGDDVTSNALTITNLPRQLSGAAPDQVEVRGEVFIGFSEFARINRERESIGEEVYANPRNLAAGTLKLTDPAEVATRRLEVVFYGYGAWEPTTTRPESQWAYLEQLRAWGLPTVAAPQRVTGFAAMWVAVQQIGRERRGYAFPTDGAVVKLNQTVGQDQVGVTAEAPLWAIAYKFTPERAETRLRAITWQIGRSGVLTPVAELEPVILSGSKVARASLHNRDEIVRRDIRVGDFVYVEKAGEIIPAITGVNQAKRPADASPYVFPKNCPSCEVALVQAEGESALRCPNENCPAQVRRRIEYFASASGVGIKGLGPAMVEKLVAAGLVKNIADLYRVRREDLLALPGVGEKSADKLLAAIAASKAAEWWRFINGLGIPQVGEAGARILARRYADLTSLAQARSGELAADLGSSTALAVETFFQKPENHVLVADLLASGVRPKTGR